MDEEELSDADKVSIVMEEQQQKQEDGGGSPKSISAQRLSLVDMGAGAAAED